MPRKQITTVRLVRQSHRDGIRRLRLAYQHLAEAAHVTSSPNNRQKQREPFSQEVQSWQ